MVVTARDQSADDDARQMSEAVTGSPVLSVRRLSVEFRSDGRVVRPVHDISFDLHKGETLAIVGESGSGKSLSALALLGLAPERAIVRGQAHLGGQDIFTMSERELRRVRGRDIAMVFQDPMTSLDPVMSVGKQIVEALRTHDATMDRTVARQRSIELLASVGVPDPAERVDGYPHQFSGGMRQRAMIAIAIANRPQVLVADEPTTALDVTVQRQIMLVLERARQRAGASTILITHDLGLVAEVAQRMLVMYAGRVVELGDVHDVFAHPRHPYTVGLLRSVPAPDADDFQWRPIRGGPPDPAALPSGCAFHPRCDHSAGREPCRALTPELHWMSAHDPAAASDHASACHFWSEVRIGE